MALIREDQREWEKMGRLMTYLMDLVTNQPAPRTASIGKFAATRSVPGQATRGTAMKDGLPLEVYNEIATEAAKRYPTDFDMQVLIIKWQAEAYRKLHP
jgi:hypothetical protein